MGCSSRPAAGELISVLHQADLVAPRQLTLTGSERWWQAVTETKRNVGSLKVRCGSIGLREIFKKDSLAWGKLSQKGAVRC
jgi:hypothetical protein